MCIGRVEPFLHQLDEPRSFEKMRGKVSFCVFMLPRLADALVSVLMLRFAWKDIYPGR